MTNFHWQTGDDSGWDNRPDHGPASTIRARCRRGLLLLAILAGLAGAAGVFYRQLAQRIEISTDSRQEELLATHRLLRSLDGSSDRELLSRFLSGRDPAWAEAQEKLLEQGMLFSRPGLGLHAAGSRQQAAAEIDMSPSLTSAVITDSAIYTTSIGGGLSETVLLQEIAIYRRGPDRWLYAPPDEEFWGEEVNEQWPYLAVSYPERDRNITRRLARDISRKLGAWCAMSGPPCPSITLRFESEANRLLLPWPPSLDSMENTTLALPSPTLAGLPMDEAGYQALYRGYASQVLLRALASGGTLSREHSLLSFALMEKQLALLGLQPWVVEQPTYQLIAETTLALSGLDYLWTMPLAGASERDHALARILIDFLLDSRSAAGELAAALATLGEEGYWPWLLLSASGGMAPPAELEAAWMRHVEARRGPEE